MPMQVCVNKRVPYTQLSLSLSALIRVNTLFSIVLTWQSWRPLGWLLDVATRKVTHVGSNCPGPGWQRALSPASSPLSPNLPAVQCLRPYTTQIPLSKH
jgi:hypothetical protein